MGRVLASCYVVVLRGCKSRQPAGTQTPPKHHPPPLAPPTSHTAESQPRKQTNQHRAKGRPNSNAGPTPAARASHLERPRPACGPQREALRVALQRKGDRAGGPLQVLDCLLQQRACALSALRACCGARCAIRAPGFAPRAVAARRVDQPISIPVPPAPLARCSRVPKRAESKAAAAPSAAHR